MREGLQKILSTEETIVAISTPPGRGAIGIVRISGRDAQRIARQFFLSPTALQHRRAAVGRWAACNGEPIDEVVVTLFEGPRSYTGEDLVEVSAHGNPHILNEILSMVRSAGARFAGPGEFTLRAVMHGKMDLTQAEAVRDYIEAQTDAQARLALRQMGGAVSRQAAPAKAELIDLIALLEAGIDFAEDDIQPPDTHMVSRRVTQARSSLEKLQETYGYARLVTVGIRVVIVGRPNVGKSSLFNRLLGADRAIVTEVPGTTRDVLSEAVTLDEVPIRYFDTAGVRATADAVETIGVARTLEALSDADFALFVVDGSALLGEEDRAILARLGGLPRIAVLNKCDLGAQAAVEEPLQVRVSAKTGEGLQDLKEAMRRLLGTSRAAGFSESAISNARQNAAVSQAIESLTKAEAALKAGVPQEMVLIDLYAALGALNELTGETSTEDILGRIFSTFCIGK